MKSTTVDVASIRPTGYVLTAACAASLALFIPFNTSIIDKGAAISAFKQEFLVYACLFLPHVITMIASLVAPGARTFGLAKGLGFVTGLALLVIVPVAMMLSSLSPERDSSPFVFSGIGLFAAQVVLFRKGREGLRTAEAMGLYGGTVGTALAPLYVALLCFILLPALSRRRDERALSRDRARQTSQLKQDFARYHDKNAVVLTPPDRDDRFYFIKRCTDLYPGPGFPNDLRALGPEGNGCIEGSVANGSIGKWRVVYTPSIRHDGRAVGYRLVATDTTGVDPSAVFGIGDTSSLRPARR